MTLINDRDLIQKHISNTKIKVNIIKTIKSPFQGSEMYNWCRENFGKEKLVPHSEKASYKINEKGVWDFYGANVYFDKEEDATLFKLTWV